MFKTIKGIMQNAELKKKLLLVLFILLLYKIGTHIPVPGINSDFLKSFSQENGLLTFMNTISGGSLSSFSIFAVGIMPYITASIIIQLLQMDIVPKLAEWSKQGEAGKQKTKKLTRVITIVLALLQSAGMSMMFSRAYPGLVVNTSVWNYVIIILSLTIGTILLMVMGEVIDKKGIGNGISILIFAGIMSSIPTNLSMFAASEFQGKGLDFIAITKSVVLAICILVLVVGVIHISQAYRRIAIRYANQGVDGASGQVRESYMPIKINTAGVIPVIFSVAIIMVPTTIAQFFPNNSVARWIAGHLNYHQLYGGILYVVLIVLFSFFYAFVQMNPEKTAKDLRENNGYIPGVKPGKPTEKYLGGVLGRLTFVGAIYLAVIAVVPLVLGNIAGLPQQVQIGGTSIIIAVGVALDVYQRIETSLIQKRYQGFL